MGAAMGHEISMPIFQAFPDLAGSAGHTLLATLPTPLEIHRGSDLGLSVRHMMIKRDDKSGRAYGGNKVRKLEFIQDSDRMTSTPGAFFNAGKESIGGNEAKSASPLLII